jgi:hypothetical protein
MHRYQVVKYVIFDSEKYLSKSFLGYYNTYILAFKETF